MIHPQIPLFRFRQVILVAFSVTSLFAGCTVGPDYHAPSVDVPAKWSATQSVLTTQGEYDDRLARPELRQWWTRLNDPLLNTIVEEAVTGNLDVSTATARIREARALVRQTSGALYPSLDSSGAFTRSGAGATSLPTGSFSTTTGMSAMSSSGPTNFFQAGFDASWEVDLFGGIRRALEAAQSGLDAAQWDLRSTLLTLVGDVTTRYVEARGYQARLALARATADSQQETVRLTQARYAAGSTSGLDAANASGEAQSTVAEIPALEANYVQSVHSLAILTGREPGALITRMERVQEVPAPPLPLALGVPADVLLARPDVRAAERRYAQGTARVGQAEAARYPRVTLTGTLSTSGTHFGDLARHSSIGWSFGPAITIPLFDAGRRRAAVDIADAQRAQLFNTYRSTVLTALQDVENASVSLSRETERLQHLQSSADAYSKAAAMAQSLYRSGSTGFLEVLIAERSLYAAQDALIQSRVRITSYYIALNKALGGGWNGVDSD